MGHTTQNITGYKDFTATAVAIARAARVTVNSSGIVSAAGVSDSWIGTALEPIAASGRGTIRLRNGPGTHEFIASAAITAGAQLYAAASGKVDDATASGGSQIPFVALEAATADGDVIEAAPWAGAGIAGSEAILQFPMNLASIADGNIITSFPLTFPGTINQFEFRTTVAATTSAKLSTITLKIGSTAVTGASIALTTVSCNAVGKVTASTAITAANTFVAGDTLTLFAASTTAFVEGSGIFLVHYIPS